MALMTTMNEDCALYTLVGDSGHIVTLVSAVTFACVVIRYIDSEDDRIFDPQWKQEGFCIANSATPYWNSHYMCLYVDTAATVLLALLYYVIHKTPGLESANSFMFTGIPAVLAHGIGHGALASSLRTLGAAEVDRKLPIEFMMELSFRDALLAHIPLTIFWLCLLRASMPHVRPGHILLFAVIAIGGGHFVPSNLGFTYVQTVLLLAFSANQLASPVKDFAYAIYPLLVSVPLTFVGWMESTQCIAFVKDNLYGHVVYDAFIPFAMFCFYVICYIQTSSKRRSHSLTTSSTKKSV